MIVIPFNLKEILKEIKSKRSEGGGISSIELLIKPDVPLKYRSGVIETYPVNEPHAYVSIVHDPDTFENIYYVLEPPLSEGELALLKELKSYFFTTIDASIIIDLDKKEDFLKNRTVDFLSDYEIELDTKAMEKMDYYVIRDFLGFWKIDAIFRDPMVEDISGDGPNVPVYVYHRKYHSIKTNVIFYDSEIDSFVQILAQKSGKHISFANPLLDATLPDGSRLQASIGSEVTTRGSTFTVRKFKEEPITFIDLINFKTFSTEMIAYLWLAVENGKSILIAGGTASGKTTALNAICTFIPLSSKIVSIEDTREIQLFHKNWIPGVTLDGGEGSKTIDMYQLLRTALRQRPEYLIVGEVRGREASTLFQAMATGHVTYSTIHADSPDAVIRRLTNPPIDVPLLLLEGLDIICVVAMVKIETKKSRRCRQIVEVTGLDLENKKLVFNELFVWNHTSDSFDFSGESNIFNEIMDSLNIGPEELSEEFKRRVKILEWMREKNMHSIQDVASMMVEYYHHPEKFMRKFQI